MVLEEDRTVPYYAKLLLNIWTNIQTPEFICRHMVQYPDTGANIWTLTYWYGVSMYWIRFQILAKASGNWSTYDLVVGILGQVSRYWTRCPDIGIGVWILLKLS